MSRFEPGTEAAEEGERREEKRRGSPDSMARLTGAAVPSYLFKV